jgi:hypothetical protein
MTTDPVCLADVVEEVAKEFYRGWPWRTKVRYHLSALRLAFLLLLKRGDRLPACRNRGCP